MYIVLCHIGLVPAFNAVQFDITRLYPVLACFGTAAWAGGWAACLLLRRRYFNTISSASARSHLPRTYKSYHFFPIFVSRIQTEANIRGINLLHLPLFIGNSDGIPPFTFPDMTCSILEEVCIFFS
jgi:hypothetical protein